MIALSNSMLYAGDVSQSYERTNMLKIGEKIKVRRKNLGTVNNLSQIR